MDQNVTKYLVLSALSCAADRTVPLTSIWVPHALNEWRPSKWRTRVAFLLMAPPGFMGTTAVSVPTLNVTEVPVLLTGYAFTSFLCTLAMFSMKAFLVIFLSKDPPHPACLSRVSTLSAAVDLSFHFDGSRLLTASPMNFTVPF